MKNELLDLINAYNDFMAKWKIQYDTTPTNYNALNIYKDSILLNQTSRFRNEIYLTPSEKSKIVDVNYIIKQALSKLPADVVGYDKKNNVLPDYLEHPKYNNFDAWVFIKQIEFSYFGKMYKFLVFDSATFQESILIKPETFFSKFSSSNLLLNNLDILDKRALEKEQRKQENVKQAKESLQGNVIISKYGLDINDPETEQLMRHLSNYSDEEITQWFDDGPISSEALLRMGKPKMFARRYEQDYRFFKEVVRNARRQYRNDNYGGFAEMFSNSSLFSEDRYNRRSSNHNRNFINNDTINKMVAKSLIWEERIIDLKNPLNFSKFNYDKLDLEHISTYLIPSALYCVAYDYKAIKILANDNDKIKKLLLADETFLTKQEKRERAEMFSLFPSALASFLDCEYFFSNINAISLVTSFVYENLFYAKTRFSLIRDEENNRNFYINTHKKVSVSTEWSKEFDKALELQKLEQANYKKAQGKQKNEQNIQDEEEIDDWDGIDDFDVQEYFTKPTSSKLNKNISDLQKKQEELLHKKSSTSQLLQQWNKNQNEYVKSDEDKDIDTLLDELA